jgi:hypothetical protein
VRVSSLEIQPSRRSSRLACWSNRRSNDSPQRAMRTARPRMLARSDSPTSSIWRQKSAVEASIWSQAQATNSGSTAQVSPRPRTLSMSQRGVVKTAGGVPSWPGDGFGASRRLGLLEAGETRLDLSNRNGVSGLPPTAANKSIVGIAWPNGFGARHGDGSFQRACAATVGGGEQIFVLFKELVYLTREPSLGGSGDLEDSCRLGKGRPLAAQADSATSHNSTIPSSPMSCQAYRAGYSPQLMFSPPGTARGPRGVPRRRRGRRRR